MNMNVPRPHGVELRAPEELQAKPTLQDFSAPDTVSWRRYGAYAAIAMAGVYFVATASVTTLVITGGVIAALFGLLVAWGFYVLDNVL